MNESEYHDIVDAIFDDIEDRLDEVDVDIDAERSGGVLTLVFPNGTQVILSRQVATLEIWVAAKSGGFHFRYEDGEWMCGTTGESLGFLLNRVASEQLGSELLLVD